MQALPLTTDPVSLYTSMDYTKSLPQPTTSILLFLAASSMIGSTLSSPIPNTITSSSVVIVPTTSFRTGGFDGVPYSIGPDGLLIMEAQIFYTASQTTAILSDGNFVVVGPSGAISKQEAQPRRVRHRSQPDFSHLETT